MPDSKDMIIPGISYPLNPLKEIDPAQKKDRGGVPKRDREERKKTKKEPSKEEGRKDGRIDIHV